MKVEVVTGTWGIVLPEECGILLAAVVGVLSSEE